MSAVYVAQIKNPRNPFPNAAEKGFLPLKEYLQIAKKMVKHVLGKINGRVANEMLKSDDVISNIATSIMISDWRYNPSEGVSPKTYRYGGALRAIKTYLKRRSTRRYVYSLDYTTNNGENDTDLYDNVTDDAQLEASDYAIQKVDSTNLIEILEDGKTLNDREKLCINKYFFEDKTYQCIGDEIGVTRERIRQIEAKALRRMKSDEIAQALKDYLN